MNLSGMTTLTPEQAADERRLLRGRLVSEAARVYKFEYPNYNLDPRPHVLVLGYWTNPDTGNRLLGGLNLNYATEEEFAALKKALPLILRVKTLQQRYRLGKRILPDVFSQMYRTYNKEYIHKIEPDEILLGADKKAADADKAVDVDKLKKAVAAARRDKDEPTPEKPTPEKPAPEKLAPEKPTPPADEPDLDLEKPAIDKQRDLTKIAAIKQKQDKQRRKTELATQDALMAQDETPPPPKRKDAQRQERNEIKSALDDLDELDDDDDDVTADDLSQPPSTESYRREHEAMTYLRGRAGSPPPGSSLLAVHDVLTGRTLLDDVYHHSEITEAAGWDDAHVLLLYPGAHIVHAGLPQQVVDRARRRITPTILNAL